MADNDQKTEQDMDSNEVIESEVVKTAEDTADNTSKETLEDSQTLENEQQQQNKTVVIKKGGFISFLSLILSLAALSASAYLYLESQKPNTQEPISVDVSQWKKPLANLDSKLTANINQLQSKLTQSQKQSASLIAQLDQIKLDLKQTKPLELTSQPTQTLFDEETFSRRIEDLEAQIKQYKQQFDVLQTNVDKSNNSQKQEFKKIQTFFANQQTKPVINEPNNTSPNNFKFEMAENLLQAAVIQLDVHKNIDHTSKLLDQASSQVKQIPGQTFANFAFEIEQTVQTLSNIETLDTDSVGKQINQLKTQVANLAFESPKVEEQKDASWFDKLVVIRKIDEGSTQKLTAAEQIVIYSQLNNTFDVLSLALLSQNQQKWNSSASQISELLSKYFPNNSSTIQTQLKVLAELQLNTKYPSISSLLNSFQQYRSNQATFSKE